MPKALVVDDSRAIRLILGKIMDSLGYQVCQAANGREALEVLERESPGVSLALVDWNMPEMNGLEFVKAMRADSRYATVRLMMVTTETQAEQMIAALEAGANEYVMKPFTEEIISDKLRLMGVIE
jgi:two-component system, chemotaxis family, chemotaxis protein CheY